MTRSATFASNGASSYADRLDGDAIPSGRIPSGYVVMDSETYRSGGRSLDVG
ncbi:hypothetical protein [Geomesophilobacter sediminis]|uniref:Uncharacterized protein n=1 Tax=Geomesophilobacter sediminis TaxID=2798584 RepID=A0A8J7IPN4_9BACT|nr:hypothetical protein [Geomesophilobacter sediminis]MBJ6725583.1 hypothetical protein [Geomesophilobacter sediminis]